MINFNADLRDITQFLLLDEKISGACESLFLSLSLDPHFLGEPADDSEKERFELRPSPTSLTNEKKVLHASIAQGVANITLVPRQDRCRCIKCTRPDFNRGSGREITGTRNAHV